MQRTTSIQKGGKTIIDNEISLAETLHEQLTAVATGKLNTTWGTVSWFNMDIVSTNESKT